MRRTQYLLGTLVTVTAVAPDRATAAQAVTAALDEIARIEALLTTYHPESEISRLNRSEGAWISVSPETLDVLAEAVRFAEMTRGAFDPTVGPLIDLWREAERRGRAPTDEERVAASKRVGYRRIQVDRHGSRARLEIGTRVDLGAIGKGYAVDRAAEAMMRAGASGGVVEAGGDLLLVGDLPDDLRDVSIRDPRPPPRVHRIGSFSGGTAVATSGGYERSFQIGDQRYGHVIDPATGLPTDSLLSATVIAPSATMADALATAILVRGQDEAQRLANEQGIEYTIFHPDGWIEDYYDGKTERTDGR
ncbi:MAG: FAD:protein FMN transferase [Planctomycetota bacterium]|nr:FAD:protein FMN transferase [Planctomycetota bacterium]